MIEIVEGDATDIAAIMPIMNDAFDPAFGEAWSSTQCLSALAMPDCRLLIAKEQGGVCGFAISRWVLDTEELLMIGVARKYQRKNIGSLLLQHIIRIARKAGRTQLFLEVRDGNLAHHFYEKFGFQPIGRRKNYYKGTDGARPDAVTMSFLL